jgi:hypothetical protein
MDGECGLGSVGDQLALVFGDRGQNVNGHRPGAAGEDRRGARRQRKGDTMTLGGATLTHVLYRFYNGGFSRAYLISIKRPDQPAAMIAALKAQYGAGAKPNQFMDDYLWNGPVGSVYLSCSSVTHECSSFIASTAVLKQEEADKAAAAARGKKDF